MPPPKRCSAKPSRCGARSWAGSRVSRRSLNNLGVLLYLKARDPQVETLYREALAINSRRFGDEHPQTAETAQNLAQVLQESGRLKSPKHSIGER